MDSPLLTPELRNPRQGEFHAASGYALELEPREQVTPGGRSARAGVTCGRKEVWSCGGGTQSIAIAALIVLGKLPKPDVSVIVDTGYEKESTWDYMETVLVPNLAKVGVTLHRVKRTEWATKSRNGVFSPTNGHLLIPAFSGQSGEPAKLTNFCSAGWKQEVSDRWLAIECKLPPRERRKWLGFSLDEPRRFMSFMDADDVWLPLVHGVPMRRNDCRTLVTREMRWPEPPRSNCWMCPNQADEEWMETLRSRPDEFAAAVRLERAMRERDPHAYLHGQCVPLDEVDWKKPQLDFVRACNSGECFV